MYNRQKAARYAEKWALGRNPAFFDFTGLGGDCTNFVSQCLLAGCGSMNYTPVWGWYYISPENRTPSWTGVEFLYDFLINNKEKGPFCRETTPEKAQIGDIIQLGTAQGNWYHTMIITALAPMKVCAHTNEAKNRHLSSYSYEMIRYLAIEAR